MKKFENSICDGLVPGRSKSCVLSESDLKEEDRETSEDEDQEVGQQEGAAPVLVHQEWKPPNIT